MVRSFQKLVRNGNSTQITIPRQILHALEWAPDQLIRLKILEDRSLQVIRVHADDTGQRNMKPVVQYTIGDVEP